MFQWGECRYVSLRLWDYSNGRLPNEEEARVQAHIKQCARCSQLAARDSLKDQMAAYKSVSIPNRQGDFADFVKRVGEHNAIQEPRFPNRTRVVVYAFSAVCVCAVAIPLGIGLSRHGSRPRVQVTTQDNYRAPKVGETNDHGPTTQPPTQQISMPGGRPGPSSPIRNVRLQPAQPGDSISHSKVTAQVDDMAYLNTDAPSAVVSWSTTPQSQLQQMIARIDRQAGTKDDFITVPLKQIASSDPRAIKAAVDAYQQEKSVVDARLARNVTLAAKAMAFSDLCRQLTETTGIEFKAAKSTADEKATIFCEDKPLRDVMRQVTHVFGFQWARNGEEGKYTYELSQDLRSQLAEQELCNRDINASLVDIDSQMSTKKYDERREEYNAAELFKQLSPADLAALRNGQEVTFSGWSGDPSHRLSPDMNKSVVNNFPSLQNPDGPFKSKPGINGMISFRINRSELGQLTLESGVNIFQVQGNGEAGAGYGGNHVLATGQSPASARPDNATANSALSRDSELQKTYTIHPKPSCPAFAKSNSQDKSTPEETPMDRVRRMFQEAATDSYTLLQRAERGTEAPHVTSADVWEEVHKQTGMPVVADSYMRLHKQPAVSVDKVTLFDALNRISDAMKTRWKREDGFLQARSVSFHWDKRKEIPNRLLQRWSADSRQKHGLPLEDMVEMAGLSDEQLDSVVVGDVAVHCWGLPEWDVMQRPMGYYSARPFARLMATMSADQRKKFMSLEGASFGTLNPNQQQKLMNFMLKDRADLASHPEFLTSARYRIDYVPAGLFVWRPETDGSKQLDTNKWPIVADKSADTALAEARKIDPTANSGQIMRSSGILSVTQFDEKNQAFLIQGIRPGRYR